MPARALSGPDLLIPSQVPMKVDCAIIGGGIVGLSVGMALLRRQPGVKLLVLEKETCVGDSSIRAQ